MSRERGYSGYFVFCLYYSLYPVYINLTVLLCILSILLFVSCLHCSDSLTLYSVYTTLTLFCLHCSYSLTLHSVYLNLTVLLCIQSTLTHSILSILLLLSIPTPTQSSENHHSPYHKALSQSPRAPAFGIPIASTLETTQRGDSFFI
jgi:hypothetical protein